MNILIVSENFLNGGLETQINTTVESLKNKVNFFFAIRAYNTNWNLANVHTNFHFSYNSTIADFCDDVNNLISIIKKDNINVIHAHPFYSFFPAVFAAKICNIPICYTYHGIASYSFTQRINDSILYNMLLDYETDKIFSVSMEGIDILGNIVLDKNKLFFLPNSINMNLFKKTDIINNKSWALVSRIDPDKISTLSNLISHIDELDISKLHIFGDGTEVDKLKDIILQNHLENRIFLEGFCNNMHDVLLNKYNGLIGIGRACMEGLAMGYPVILLGYNKISGLIDSKMYNYIKNENFSNKHLAKISTQDLSNQLQTIYNGSYDKTFYSNFSNTFNSEIISESYYNQLMSISSHSSLNLDLLFDELKNINNNLSFYDDSQVYNLLKKHFTLFCRNSTQKNYFILADTVESLNKTLQEKILNESDNFNKKILEQENNFNKKILEQENNFNKKILEQENNLNGKILNQNNNLAQKILEQESHFNEKLRKNELLAQKIKENLDDISMNTMTLNNLKRKIKYKFKH